MQFFRFCQARYLDNGEGRTNTKEYIQRQITSPISRELIEEWGNNVV